MQKLYLLIFICLFIPFLPYSQGILLRKQVKALIADTSNYFRSFKGEFKNLDGQDSVFFSANPLENTLDNVLSQSKGVGHYMCDIEKSVSKKKGKQQIDEWMYQLSAIVGNAFPVEKTKPVEWNPGVYGWSFHRGNLIIGITLFPNAPKKDDYFIGLSFMFTDHEIAYPELFQKKKSN